MGSTLDSSSLGPGVSYGCDLEEVDVRRPYTAHRFAFFVGLGFFWTSFFGYGVVSIAGLAVAGFAASVAWELIAARSRRPDAPAEQP